MSETANSGKNKSRINTVRPYLINYMYCLTYGIILITYLECFINSPLVFFLYLTLLCIFICKVLSIKDHASLCRSTDEKYRCHNQMFDIYIYTNIS